MTSAVEQAWMKVCAFCKKAIPFDNPAIGFVTRMTNTGPKAFHMDCDGAILAHQQRIAGR